MTEQNQPQQSYPDEVIRERVLERATEITITLLAQLRTVADDLDAGGHRAALGGLDGIERQIDTLRSLLLLLR